MRGAAAGLLLIFAACSRSSGPADVRPALATDPVSADPDDPAIWVHAGDPARSLILGTNKSPAPQGALAVFGLDGKTRQTIDGLDRPNNVDVEYGLLVPGGPIDLAVVTERYRRRLRIYKVTAEGLTDITSPGGTSVFEGQAGESGEPMGIGLYRRSRDGSIFAIVSRKTGPREGYLWQYDLQHDGAGKVKAVKVREFGRFSGTGEIEAVAVDDALGYVYYADEGDGIHKYYADPDHPDAARELAWFGREGFRGDREGIAIYARPDNTGYVLCTDQLAGNSRYFVYPRDGDQSKPLRVFSGGADETDGADATAASLGPQFPQGLFVVMNSGPKNFLIYRWEDIEALLGDSR
jgi:3-phytase